MKLLDFDGKLMSRRECFLNEVNADKSTEEVNVSEEHCTKEYQPIRSKSFRIEWSQGSSR